MHQEKNKKRPFFFFFFKQKFDIYSFSSDIGSGH